VLRKNVVRLLWIIFAIVWRCRPRQISLGLPWGAAMKLIRRQFMHLAAGAAALPAASRFASAQTNPTRPITMIVPVVAGGPADVIARLLAERMRYSLGQPIIIENIGGADGSIGTGRAARARPHGYTIDLGFLGSHVLNGAFYSLPYDVLNDFAPISPLATNSFGLFARKTLPPKDLKELITWLKANSDKASAGVSAVSVRLVTVFFRKETGTQFGLVPYRGGAPAMQDVMAGQIDLLFGTPGQLPLTRTGSIKAYAVTGDRRLAGEMGLPAASWSEWSGLFAPRRTPTDIIGTLNAAAVEALADPAVRSRLAELGYEVFRREQQTPEALGALVKADAEKWWQIIKEFGIKGEWQLRNRLHACCGSVRDTKPCPRRGQLSSEAVAVCERRLHRQPPLTGLPIRTSCSVLVCLLSPVADMSGYVPWAAMGQNPTLGVIQIHGF
jgi:tripartite-type tricarboxylate transporter receptor subunit TctC